jgi:hypothetical protein
VGNVPIPRPTSGAVGDARHANRAGLVTMPKLRMKIGISGITSVGEGKTYSDIKRGDVIEIDDERVVTQYLEHGYAELRLEGDIGQPYRTEIVPNW